MRLLKTYIISPAVGRYAERLNYVLTSLVSHNFQNVEHIQSLAAETPTQSLTNTVLSIFQRELARPTFEPFLILEDDVALRDQGEPAIPLFETEIPSDTDVLYLGVSCWSYPHSVETLFFPAHRRPHIVWNSEQTVENFSPVLTRLKGMTGGHAIAFLSAAFITDFLGRMFEISERQPNVPHDLLLSAMHPSWCVYALKKPLFFQKGELGGQEEQTRLEYDGVAYRLAK